MPLPPEESADYNHVETVTALQAIQTVQLISQEAGRVTMLVSQSARWNIAHWATEFAQAQPFRHVIIDDFLERDFCEWLMQEFPGFEAAHAVNELGVVGRKSVVSDIPRIGAAYREFDRLMRDREFLEWIGTIAGISNLLYDPEYIGGGAHENLDGQELDYHVDFNYHPRQNWHRRLNLIVFLNPEWTPAWGGCLELLSNPWEPLATNHRMVVPVANRAVLFETTETSWHGFNRIVLPPEKQHLSRQSLAVYFYTKDRSAEETAPSHGTIYVPRSLPERLLEGYTLTQDDVDELSLLVERRNAQIRFLYERELEFSEVLFGITKSLSFRVGRAITWPARWIRRK